ncbi:helix-turn-helix domain-containing protein, partial [Streptomyces sp. NPDC039022]|uniref:helix-turn-helix domain-containing protein n=1 Tax=Streptomyces sp. NPDC039022 TaxID=3157091 RepID=UPI00340F0270
RPRKSSTPSGRICTRSPVQERTVAAVACRVGYASPSAFVAAFRRVVGVPPGVYFSP